MNRKIITAVLVLMIICTIPLAACGSKDAASDDPNLGVWNAATGEMMGISMDIADFFGEGFIIELKSGGKCALTVDGEKANGKWTLESGAFTVSGGGFDGSGRLENGSLILEDVLGMGLTVIFEKEGGHPAAEVTASSNSSAEDGSLSDYEYHPEYVTAFEGDWFGVIYFESGFGIWEGLDGAGCNVVARFAFRNGECEAFFSAEVDPGSEYLDFGDITARIGTNGLAISGKLLDLAFENTLVRVTENEPAIMYLMADDGTDGYDATLYLRPWGETWNDDDLWTPTDENIEFVAESTFEEIVEILGGDVSQIPAPTNIAGMGRIYGGIVDNKPAGGTKGGEKPVEGSNESGKTPTAGDDPTDKAISKYNLDSATDEWIDMSSERLTEAELLAKYEIISNTSMYTMDYDEVVELFGAEPSSFRLEGTKRCFMWRAEENDYHYVVVLFEVQNGKWLNYGYSKTNM